MRNHLPPITIAERLLGGIEEVGRVAGLDPKAAYHWRHPNSRRDAGDMPSVRIMRNLLAHARARGIPLTADHLIWGASAAEIDALLEQMAAAAPTVEAAE